MSVEDQVNDSARVLRELRIKRAELSEMMFKNEVVISDMEEMLRRAAVDSAARARHDACCSTAEDFRENWRESSDGGFSSHPVIALEKLDAALEEETNRFRVEQAAFIERIRELQASYATLRSIVQSRLRD